MTITRQNSRKLTSTSNVSFEDGSAPPKRDKARKSTPAISLMEAARQARQLTRSDSGVSTASITGQNSRKLTRSNSGASTASNSRPLRRSDSGASVSFDDGSKPAAVLKRSNSGASTA